MTSRRSAGDTTAYLVFVLLAWAGILAGFGPNAWRTATGLIPPREIILHVHALVFLGWMAILALQVWLVRAGRTDLHRRFGPWFAIWAVVLVAIGVVTAFHVHGARFASGGSGAGLVTAFASMTSFSLLIVPAFLLRRRPDWHKRLVVGATIGILAAAFSRALGPLLDPLVATDAPVGDWFTRYAGSNIMILLALGWDLRSRGAIHPAWLIAAPVLVSIQIGGTALRHSELWLEIAPVVFGR